MEAEEYAELLKRLRDAYDEVIGKHGGMVFRMVGDAVLACFGYPDAQEDDGRRATEAALELHEMVRSFSVRAPPGFSLTLHTGIHAGLVLLEEGDDVTGRMVLFGDTVNIAARLSDAARRDEILVSKETLGAERHFFNTDVGRTLDCPGFKGPISVWKIVGRAPVVTRFEARTKRGLTPFIGRKSELQLLANRLQEAIAGKPQCLAISAPPGLGKTRLAEEFLSGQDMRNAQIFRGYCESYLSAEPLQPFLQMLRSICGLSYGMSPQSAVQSLEQSLKRIDPALLKHKYVLQRALSLSLDLSIDKHETDGDRVSAAESVAVTCGLFDALAAKQPLVLFIDDWQWADDAARQLLAGIRSLCCRPIFVLIATRQSPHENVGLVGAEVLTLTPLNQDESEKAIQHLLPGTNAFAMSEICGDSGGNPLFLEELCHWAAHKQSSAQKKQIQTGRAWLDKLIETRVERLPKTHKNLIRIAAVIGNVIPVAVLKSVSGYDSHHPVIAELTNRDLLYPGDQPDTLRFKHGIARDVIYETVGLHERKALHVNIAKALGRLVATKNEEEFHELLAYHFRAAEHWDEAARYAELAGDKAIAVSALDRAQVQYYEALSALDRAGVSKSNYQNWLNIAHRLALVCVFDPSLEHLGILLRAIELAIKFDDERARGHAEYWVGYVYYGLGNFREATRYLENGLERAKKVDDASLIKWCGATLGQAYAAASKYSQSLELLDEAIDAKRQRKRSNRPAVGYAYTLACKASVLGDRGRFDEAEECFKEAQAAVKGSGHEVEGSILCWRSGVQLWQGQWHDALQSAHEAQLVAERVKSLYLYSMSRSLSGYAVWMIQESSEALQAVLEATTWLESAKKDLFISLNYGWLSEILVAKQQWHVARQYAARAFNRSRSYDRIGCAMSCRALARAASLGHGHKPFQHYLALAAHNAETRESPHEVAQNKLCEAEIQLTSGERERAIMLLEAAARTFDELSMTWHKGRTLSLLTDRK